MQTATTDGRTDGHTDVRIDGRMNGRTDSPTFRTNWSHEILGEPKKDSGIFAEKRRRSAQANDKKGDERRLRERSLKRRKAFGRVLMGVRMDRPICDIYWDINR